MALITEIAGRKMMLSVRHISGSFRGARKLALAYHGELEKKMRSVGKVSSEAMRLARERISMALDGP